MIAQGTMAFNSLRSSNPDLYSVLQILVILKSIFSRLLHFSPFFTWTEIPFNSIYKLLYSF
jgi:hypothetical protein